MCVPSDVDNSHMLSIIEQKMCTDDRKVWSRELERDGKKATLQGLIDWMAVEMEATHACKSAIENRFKHPFS